jgi:hypothetical protein
MVSGALQMRFGVLLWYNNGIHNHLSFVWQGHYAINRASATASQNNDSNSFMILLPHLRSGFCVGL